MREGKAIAAADLPRTRESLAADLRELGLAPGMTVIVHSSLSSLGWVAGGPVAVIQALIDVVTADGTIVMPAQSGDLSDPAPWQRPPVPEHWWPIIREQMPAFDPAITPTRGMGRIAELFRTWPGALRSNHPTSSFAAWGRQAGRVVKTHSLAYSLGEESPLGQLYQMEAQILLLGVGHDSNTSIHLAEYRIPHQQQIESGSPVYEQGKRMWKTYLDIELDSDRFPAAGAAFEATGRARIGKVGSAEARLLPMRDLVDFAVAYWTNT